MTSAIFHYAIRHIFMTDFWLFTMNRHPSLTTLFVSNNFSHTCKLQLGIRAGNRFDHRPSLSRPPFFSANPGLSVPRGARLTPASRVARFPATCRHAPPPARAISAREDHAPPAGHRKLAGPVSNAVSCSSRHISAPVSVFARQLVPPLLLLNWGFFLLVKNGFFWSCFLLLWDSYHHYCKTQLKTLFVLVCFSGVVVS